MDTVVDDPAEPPGGHPRATAGITLGMVLLATLVTLGLGAALKAPCAAGDWRDGRQYKRLCYSDIVPLYGTEDLQGNRLPYLDACPIQAGLQCDEYPALTMYFMRFAAWASGGYGDFYYANVVGLAAAALAVAWALFRLVGARALYFALAPTLLIYGFVNWDLLAVALAAGATLAFARRRDGLSGMLLGLGAAAKLFPGLLLVPFALERLRRGERDRATALAAGTVGAYAAVNLPFALVAPHQWVTFFRFNTLRPVDWDSLWFVVCQRIHGGTACSWSPGVVNAASLALFVAVSAAVLLFRRRRSPELPVWTFAFPLLIVFLLTNKVYSPQYGLWLLPWFALALPNPWLFGLFELTDVAVFLTRFTWFGRLSADSGDQAFRGFHGAPLGAFEFAVAARALVLVACVVVWALGERGRHAIGTARRGEVARASPGLLEATA